MNHLQWTRYKIGYEYYRAFANTRHAGYKVKEYANRDGIVLFGIYVENVYLTSSDTLEGAQRIAANHDLKLALAKDHTWQSNSHSSRGTSYQSEANSKPMPDRHSETTPSTRTSIERMEPSALRHGSTANTSAEPRHRDRPSLTPRDITGSTGMSLRDLIAEITRRKDIYTALRESLNLTNEDVAALCDNVTDTPAKWEKGAHRAPTAVLLLLALLHAGKIRLSDLREIKTAFKKRRRLPPADAPHRATPSQ